MWKRWIQSMKKKTAGTTLVELIVTFALIGIFMTAASFMLSSTLNLFARMQATYSAVTVSDLLLDKIAGEIAAAREPQMDKNDEAIGDGYYFWMAADEKSEWITMWNRSKSPLAIYAEPDPKNSEEGRVLCLKYYETVRGNASVSREGTTIKTPEINWHFDENVYMGYRITEDGLTFTREDPENHPNVIRIDLEIRNERTGFTYQTSRYAESYNYEFKLDQVHKYMGVRSVGVADRMPVTAEEFWIEKSEKNPEEVPGEGGEEEESPPVVEQFVNYTILFQNMKKQTLAPSETREGVVGTFVEVTTKAMDETNGVEWVYPPQIAYYTYDKEGSLTSMKLDADEENNRLLLCYRPSDEDPVPITIINRNRETEEILGERTEYHKIESQVSLVPEVLDGYECVSEALSITVGTDTMGPYYFDYEPVQDENSITVTDSDGRKHVLTVSKNWTELREDAAKKGVQFSKTEMMSDESGFYIIINGPYFGTDVGGKTLAEVATSKQSHMIKITKDTKIFTESDLIWKDGHKVWPDVYPQRGELAFYKNKYYIAQGPNQNDMPPNGVWIALP